MVSVGNICKMKFLTKKKKKDEAAANNNECFLNLKRMKRWEDAKSGNKLCFMLYARALYVTWGADERQFWVWNSFKDTNDENIEVAKLSHQCWLDVRGKLMMSTLSSATLYEVVYEVKLTKRAHGWEIPVKLRLSLPNGTVKERQVSLLQKPKGEWFELNVGNFRTDETSSGTGEVGFDLYEHGDHWKHGIVIRGAILRPKL